MEIFYSLADNSAYVRGAVPFCGAYARERLLTECQLCGARQTEPAEVISLVSPKSEGGFWPDAKDCFTGIPGLYVSARVKETLDEARLRYGKALPAAVQKPYPVSCRGVEPPSYWLITGELGAKLDFASSGFRVISVCQSCGTVKTDPRSRPNRAEFVENSWNGSHIFYTDLSPVAMFCSEHVLELAHQHKWTNFRFLRLEEAYDSFSKGIDYFK